MIALTGWRWLAAVIVSLFIHLTAVGAFYDTTPNADDERSAGALAEVSVALTPSQYFPSSEAEEQDNTEQAEETDTPETAEEADTREAEEADTIDALSDTEAKDIKAETTTEQPAESAAVRKNSTASESITAEAAPSVAAANAVQRQQSTPVREAGAPAAVRDVASVEADAGTSEIAVPNAPGSEVGTSLGVASSAEAKEAAAPSGATAPAIKTPKEVTSRPTKTELVEAVPEAEPIRQAAIDKSRQVETVTETEEVREYIPVVRPKPVIKKQKPKPDIKKTKQKPKQQKKKAKTKKKKTTKVKKSKKRGSKKKKSRAAAAASSSRQGTSRKRAGDGGRSSKAAGRAKLSSYLGRVSSKVRRQKRYPASERRKKKGGTVVVAFTITRGGSVTGVRLKRRSGNAALDREVLAMVRRAAPFPPIPREIGRSRLALSIPVRFKSR